MLLFYRSCLPSKNVSLFNVLVKRESSQILSFVSSRETSEKLKIRSQEKTNFNDQLYKSIHLTKVNNDVGSGLAKIGVGFSGVGIGLAAMGVGLAAGNAIQALSRNPSVAEIKTLLFVVCGMIEGLGLFILLLGGSMLLS